jgi:hypothetical protein
MIRRDKSTEDSRGRLVRWTSRARRASSARRTAVRTSSNDTARSANSSASSRARPRRTAAGTRRWHRHAASSDTRPQYERVKLRIALRARSSRLRNKLGSISVGGLREILLGVGIAKWRANRGQLMQKPPLVGAWLDLVLFARKLVDDSYADPRVADPVSQFGG